MLCKGDVLEMVTVEYWLVVGSVYSENAVDIDSMFVIDFVKNTRYFLILFQI